MSHPQYGRTWWGAQWLQALTQIDHDNRLPRGRSYANRGAVRDLVVTDSKVTARVQGSRPRPYDVDIGIPKVDGPQAGRLVDRLAEDPGLVARLLNRELDPSVLQMAQQLKMPIFPARWSDLKMHCSCPDWAVPCKHLAAVIYLLSQQIDADPFLVFSLCGIDLPALLKQRGVLDDVGATALPAVAQALFGDEPATAALAAGAAAAEESDASALSPLWHLDLTTIPDLRQTLWRVLPANPVFHRGGDFRELAQAQLARIARQAAKAMESSAAENPVALPTGRLRLTVDDSAVVAVAGVEAGGTTIGTLPEMFDLLDAVAPSQLDDLPTELAAEFAALWQLRLLAWHLLAKGAVVPELMLLAPHTVALRWLPAELDATVRDIVQRAATGVPAGLVQRRRGRKSTALAAVHQARLLLSLLLDHGVFAGSEPGHKAREGLVPGGGPNAISRVRAESAGARPKALDGKIPQLFFGTGRGHFDGPGETAWPGSIQTWLARLHLARQPIAPVLQLDESASGDGFALSIAVADEAQALHKPTPLATVMKAPAWQARRMAVLQTVALLSEFHPPLAGYVRSGAREPLPLDLSELPAFLFEALPAIRLLGIRALLPKSLDRLLRPRLSMQIKATATASPSFLKADQIFSFDWQVALGEQMLTPKEFERLLGQATGVVRFKGEYAYLDPAAIEQLRQQLAKPPRLSAQDLLRVALAGSFEGAPVGLNKAARKLLDELKDSAPIALPTGLQAAMRPYQVRGFEWLARNARLGLGSVIADDMGLGKTLQVIALLLHLKERGELDASRALVIVPTSLLTNWQKEVARFAPALSVEIYHGSKRALSSAAGGAARPDLLLTTYGVARAESARLKALPWRIVVVDEAQNLKNPAAAQTKAVKAIVAATHVAMSGTPVENRLSDYWSIVDFAQAGYLGGLTHFGREFATPIQTDRDAAAAERLKRVLAPFLLRRMKSDKTIVSDLPDKIEQNQHCTLSTAQVALYESVVREGLASIAGESDTFQRQGLVLQMILALKQVCNHPAQYLKQGGDDPLASGKVERLFDLLDEIEAARQKVLVFTQFREMGELLQRWLRERRGSGFGSEPQFLHGGVPRARRDKMVERFQTEPSERVFLLSLKAGGTGLNLTAASHVVHFDLWWNPAVEAQATDRAYRIGQQRNVQVHRFITRGTFEERIDAMIRSKRELAEMAVGTGETWIGQLPEQELKRLFELGTRA
jgi:uncharacterized Zn finger protein